jgi:proline iminopeptidase
VSAEVGVTIFEETVEIRGVKLHTRTTGHGPDVVVLHGGPGAHHDYLLPHFDSLAAGRRLRYYDQRGGGRSTVSREAPVGWREHVEDLNALIEHWELGSATILGYSWGALLALLHAATYPEHVARLALVSPAPLTKEHRDEFQRRFSDRMAHPRVADARRELQESGLRAKDPEAYRKQAFELSVAGYFKDPTRASELTPFRVTGRTQQAVWNSVGSSELSTELDELSELCVPALVLHGMDDPIPLATAEHVADLLCSAKLEVLDDVGHVPHVEDFESFVSILDAFLPKQP